MDHARSPICWPVVICSPLTRRTHGFTPDIMKTLSIVIWLLKLSHPRPCLWLCDRFTWIERKSLWIRHNWGWTTMQLLFLKSLFSEVLLRNSLSQKHQIRGSPSKPNNDTPQHRSSDSVIECFLIKAAGFKYFLKLLVYGSLTFIFQPHVSI